MTRITTDLGEPNNDDTKSMVFPKSPLLNFQVLENISISEQDQMDSCIIKDDAGIGIPTPTHESIKQRRSPVKSKTLEHSKTVLTHYEHQEATMNTRLKSNDQSLIVVQTQLSTSYDGSRATYRDSLEKKVDILSSISFVSSDTEIVMAADFEQSPCVSELVGDGFPVVDSSKMRNETGLVEEIGTDRTSSVSNAVIDHMSLANESQHSCCSMVEENRSHQISGCSTSGQAPEEVNRLCALARHERYAEYERIRNDLHTYNKRTMNCYEKERTKARRMQKYMTRPSNNESKSEPNNLRCARENNNQKDAEKVENLNVFLVGSPVVVCQRPPPGLRNNIAAKSNANCPIKAPHKQKDQRSRSPKKTDRLNIGSRHQIPNDISRKKRHVNKQQSTTKDKQSNVSVSGADGNQWLPKIGDGHMTPQDRRHENGLSEDEIANNAVKLPQINPKQVSSEEKEIKSENLTGPDMISAIVNDSSKKREMANEEINNRHTPVLTPKLFKETNHCRKDEVKVVETKKYDKEMVHIDFNRNIDNKDKENDKLLNKEAGDSKDNPRSSITILERGICYERKVCPEAEKYPQREASHQIGDFHKPKVYGTEEEAYLQREVICYDGDEEEKTYIEVDTNEKQHGGGTVSSIIDSTIESKPKQTLNLNNPNLTRDEYNISTISNTEKQMAKLKLPPVYIGNPTEKENEELVVQTKIIKSATVRQHPQNKDIFAACDESDSSGVDSCSDDERPRSGFSKADSYDEIIKTAISRARAAADKMSRPDLHPQTLVKGENKSGIKNPRKKRRITTKSNTTKKKVAHPKPIDSSRTATPKGTPCVKRPRSNMNNSCDHLSPFGKESMGNVSEIHEGMESFSTKTIHVESDGNAHDLTTSTDNSRTDDSKVKSLLMDDIAIARTKLGPQLQEETSSASTPESQNRSRNRQPEDVNLAVECNDNPELPTFRSQVSSRNRLSDDVSTPSGMPTSRSQVSSRNERPDDVNTSGQCNNNSGMPTSRSQVSSRNERPDDVNTSGQCNNNSGVPTSRSHASSTNGRQDDINTPEQCHYSRVPIERSQLVSKNRHQECVITQEQYDNYSPRSQVSSKDRKPGDNNVVGRCDDTHGHQMDYTPLGHNLSPEPAPKSQCNVKRGYYHYCDQPNSQNQYPQVEMINGCCCYTQPNIDNPGSQIRSRNGQCEDQPNLETSKTQDSAMYGQYNDNINLPGSQIGVRNGHCIEPTNTAHLYTCHTEIRNINENNITPRSPNNIKNSFSPRPQINATNRRQREPIPSRLCKEKVYSSSKLHTRNRETKGEKIPVEQCNDKLTINRINNMRKSRIPRPVQKSSKTTRHAMGGGIKQGKLIEQCGLGNQDDTMGDEGSGCPSITVIVRDEHGQIQDEKRFDTSEVVVKKDKQSKLPLLNNAAESWIQQKLYGNDMVIRIRAKQPVPNKCAREPIQGNKRKFKVIPRKTFYPSTYPRATETLNKINKNRSRTQDIRNNTMKRVCAPRNIVNPQPPNQGPKTANKDNKSMFDKSTRTIPIQIDLKLNMENRQNTIHNAYVNVGDVTNCETNETGNYTNTIAEKPADTNYQLCRDPDSAKYGSLEPNNTLGAVRQSEGDARVQFGKNASAYQAERLSEVQRSPRSDCRDIGTGTHAEYPYSDNAYDSYRSLLSVCELVSTSNNSELGVRDKGIERVVEKGRANEHVDVDESRSTKVVNYYTSSGVQKPDMDCKKQVTHCSHTTTFGAKAGEVTHHISPSKDIRLVNDVADVRDERIDWSTSYEEYNDGLTTQYNACSKNNITQGSMSRKGKLRHDRHIDLQPQEITPVTREMSPVAGLQRNLYENTHQSHPLSSNPVERPIAKIFVPQSSVASPQMLTRDKNRQCQWSTFVLSSETTTTHCVTPATERFDVTNLQGEKNRADVTNNEENKGRSVHFDETSIKNTEAQRRNKSDIQKGRESTHGVSHKLQEKQDKRTIRPQSKRTKQFHMRKGSVTFAPSGDANIVLEKSNAMQQSNAPATTSSTSSIKTSTFEGKHMSSEDGGGYDHAEFEDDGNASMESYWTDVTGELLCDDTVEATDGLTPIVEGARTWSLRDNAARESAAKNTKPESTVPRDSTPKMATAPKLPPLSERQIGRPHRINRKQYY